MMCFLYELLLLNYPCFPFIINRWYSSPSDLALASRHGTQIKYTNNSLHSWHISSLLTAIVDPLMANHAMRDCSMDIIGFAFGRILK